MAKTTRYNPDGEFGSSTKRKKGRQGEADNIPAPGEKIPVLDMKTELLKLAEETEKLIEKKVDSVAEDTTKQVEAIKVMEGVEFVEIEKAEKVEQVTHKSLRGAKDMFDRRVAIILKGGKNQRQDLIDLHGEAFDAENEALVTQIEGDLAKMGGSGESIDKATKKNKPTKDDSKVVINKEAINTKKNKIKGSDIDETVDGVSGAENEGARLRREIALLNSLKGDALADYYFKKEGITQGELKNNSDIIKRENKPTGLNFHDWKEAELIRLEKQIGEYEISEKKAEADRKVVEINKNIKEIQEELGKLEKLRGIDLQIYYWEKKNIREGDIKNAQHTAKDGMSPDRDSLNFSAWQDEEMKRLYEEMKRLEENRDSITKVEPAKKSNMKPEKKKAVPKEKATKKTEYTNFINNQDVNYQQAKSEKFVSEMSDDELEAEINAIESELQNLNEFLNKINNQSRLKKIKDLIALKTERLRILQKERERRASLKGEVIKRSDTEIQTEKNADSKDLVVKSTELDNPVVGADKSETEQVAGKKSYKVIIESMDRVAESVASRTADGEVRKLLHRPEEHMRSYDSRTRSIFNNISSSFRRTGSFLQRQWVHLAEDGYRRNFESTSLEHIENTGNLIIDGAERNYNLTRNINYTEGNRGANYEIIDQVVRECQAGVQELTETGRRVTDVRVNARIQELISVYCMSNSMPREHFEIMLKEEIDAMKADNEIDLDDISFLGEERVNAGETHNNIINASNLFAIAQEYKNDIDAKIEQVKNENNLREDQVQALKDHVNANLELDIQLGAKLGDLHNSRPRNSLGFLERTISAMQRTPVINRILPNPGVMALVLTGGTAVATKCFGGAMARRLVSAGIVTSGATVAMGVAWAPIIAGSMMAAGFAYHRRSKEVKQDSGMHKRDKTLGKESRDFRRGNLDNFNYEIRPASELLGELRSIESSGEYADLNPTQKAQLAEMFARFKVELVRDEEFRIGKEENRTVDLISIDKEEGERYGTNLMSKTDLKIELWNYLRANNLITNEGRDLLESNPEFNDLVMASYNHLNENIDFNDHNLDSYRKSSARTAAAVSGALAVVSTFGFQKVLGLVAEHYSGHDSHSAYDTIFNREKFNGVVPRIGNDELSLGVNNLKLENSSGIQEDVVLFVKDSGEIDINKSKIPTEWHLIKNANGDSALVSQGKIVTKDYGQDLWAYGQDKGLQTRNLSIKNFVHNNTAPPNGHRGLVETAKNFFHNLKLRADGSELFMKFGVNKEGAIDVDLSKYAGKSLKGLSGAKFDELLSSGRVMINFAIDNAQGAASQHHVISVPANGLHTTIPEELADIFFSVTDKGVKGQGLITLTVIGEGGDTSVSSSYNPFEGELPGSTEVGPNKIHPITNDMKYDFNIPLAVPIADASRWQLEGDEVKDKKVPQKKKEKQPKVPKSQRDFNKKSLRGTSASVNIAEEKSLHEDDASLRIKEETMLNKDDTRLKIEHDKTTHDEDNMPEIGGQISPQSEEISLKQEMKIDDGRSLHGKNIPYDYNTEFGNREIKLEAETTDRAVEEIPISESGATIKGSLDGLDNVIKGIASLQNKGLDFVSSKEYENGMKQAVAIETVGLLKSLWPRKKPDPNKMNMVVNRYFRAGEEEKFTYDWDKRGDSKKMTENLKLADVNIEKVIYFIALQSILLKQKKLELETADDSEKVRLNSEINSIDGKISKLKAETKTMLVKRAETKDSMKKRRANEGQTKIKVTA